jgi:cytochrome P450
MVDATGVKTCPPPGHPNRAGRNAMPPPPNKHKTSAANFPAMRKEVDLFAIALEDDPHAKWAEIRETSPVLDAGGGVFFISDWARVDEVLRDPRHHAGSGVADSFGSNDGLVARIMQTWLMSLDGAEQTRARGLVRREFTPRRVEALRARIESATDELLETMELSSPEKEVDLIANLAFALPSEIIRSLFGWGPSAWQKDIEAIIRSIDDRPGASLQMIEGLALHFESKVEQGEVPEGLLAQLRVPDDEHGSLSPLEVVANAVLLVTAAIDTTAGLIGNAIHCLLDRPEQIEAIRSDPSQIPAVIEETLRFEPPALSCSRRVMASFQLGGIDVPKGSQLLLGLAAANRDPKRYPDPHQFRLDRDFQGLVSFGGGRHFCMGAALARLEAQVVLERLFVRSKFDLERIESPLWQTRNPTVRALERLPVRLRSRDLNGKTS